MRPLSPREWEALRYRALGYGLGETAGRMHISVQTVKNQMSSIYEKLGVKDGNICAALREVGWLHVPEDSEPMEEALHREQWRAEYWLARLLQKREGEHETLA